MSHHPGFILSVLDECSRSFTFPSLDNGYVYLAASRLSLHYSATDWALVVEVFGFSPRAGLPDLCVYTFASRLYNRQPPEMYTAEQRATYLANNANNEMAFYYPIADGAWIDEENQEMVSAAGLVELRGNLLPLPSLDQYARQGIHVENNQPAIYELCRYLASLYRDSVLATPAERRANLPPDLEELCVLEDWHHPDVIASELPSQTETFRQLAYVLSTGDCSRYAPGEAPNTHWRHWPLGGSL
jgi:hypothetical protein